MDIKDYLNKKDDSEVKDLSLTLKTGITHSIREMTKDLEKITGDFKLTSRYLHSDDILEDLNRIHKNIIKLKKNVKAYRSKKK